MRFPHDFEQRAVLPQFEQTALPREIYYQPVHIGGSLGFGAKDKFQTFWDKLEVEADAEAAAAPGAPAVPGMPGAGGKTNLRQYLNNFLFQAATFSQLVIPYNRDRKYLMMQNKGVSSVFVAFGRAADVNSGFEMAGGGGFYEPILGTVQSVHAISAAGIQNVVIIEGFEAV